MPLSEKTKSRKRGSVNANGRMSRVAPKKSAKSKLTNARLRKLAAKHRPPQSWYDKEQDVF